MVSKRNFFSIIILLLIMIFMFMFSGVLKQELNDYGTNSYEESEEDVIRLKQEENDLRAQLTQEAKVLYGENSQVRDKRVLYLGKNLSSAVANCVKSWCYYSKRPMVTLSTLRGLKSIEASRLPSIVVVDGSDVTWEYETETLSTLARNGACVIIARMPSPEEVKGNTLFRKMAGIKDVYSSDIAIDGVRLFPGFFIGQEEAYMAEEEEEYRQDLNLKIPWYVIGEGTKTYMMGMVKDRTRKSEFLPALVWRHTYGEGNVFCINGDYASKDTGIGFLTACLSDTAAYDIYPVINAQNVVLASYGGFSDENSEVLMDIYEQGQLPLFRDVVWPALVALEEKTGAKMSLMVSPQLDYSDTEDPVKGQLIYYLRLLNEGYGEAGISTKQISDISLEEKIGKDLVYWETEAMSYKLQAAYLENKNHYDATKNMLPHLKTVVIPEESGMPVKYLDDVVTLQMATANGLTHTFGEDLELKAYETALGYSNVVFDMSMVSHPEGSDWADFSRRTSSNLITYWKRYSGFAHTTLSESDARIRRFFALDYSDSKTDNRIHLHIDHFDQSAYFVLKLNVGELDEVEGATYSDLKNCFYLLEAQQEDVYITLKDHKLFIH